MAHRKNVMRDLFKPNDFIAVNTFGMGARPGEFTAARTDPRGWLLSQISESDSVLIEDADLISTPQIIFDYLQGAKLRRATRKTSQNPFSLQRKVHPPQLNPNMIYQNEISARARHAMLTSSSFGERWARFWSNHFSVSGRGPLLRGIVGSYEREAIRPNVFGRFSDLLSAAVLHPTMLLYLDNDISIGPNSRVGVKSGKSYNENLAREVLELHTIGLGGGYKIEDIISFANALTGWTVSRTTKLPETFGQAYFNSKAHEPGTKTFMSLDYKDNGHQQAPAILNWLSSHPATAYFLARKIIRHFVSRKPIPKLESALRDNFLETGGDLSALAKTLVSSDLAWSQNEWAYKSPQEFVISVGRAIPEYSAWQDMNITRQLGQAPFEAPSPEGWPATGATSITAENILRRMSWLREAIAAAPDWMNEFYLIEEILGGTASQDLRDAAAKPHERVDVLRMVMMSPEFLMR